MPNQMSASYTKYKNVPKIAEDIFHEKKDKQWNESNSPRTKCSTILTMANIAW